MNFTDAVKTCLSKYVVFEGRAGRPEFWWFFLFQVIVSIVAGMIWFRLQNLAGLALLLPALAVGARRLHDIGKSGWFQLLWFIPFIGWGVLIYWAVQPSQAGSNAWGAPAGPTAIEPPKAPGEM